MLRIRQYVFEKVKEKELGETRLINRLRKGLEECKQQVNLLKKYITMTSIPQVKGSQ